ncbi:MAG TPA: hypothetical protein VMX35_13015 [Acidobacteriota bacterium]|nr:hypothetical protein [Acidobacteriota bacterium]
MKKAALVIFTILALLAPAFTYAMDSWEAYAQQDDNWKKLQSFRVWTIIDTLELDATSEKGIAVLDAINRFAEKEHQYFGARGKIAYSIRQALLKQPVDDNEIARLIEELDKLNGDYLHSKIEEHQVMKNLLTPLERAKLIMAEEKFRQHLREAMHRSRSDDKKRPYRR